LAKILPGFFVLGIARLMTITKQATSRVTAIKLPDGQRDQTGKESLKELIRFRFSTLIDGSNNR
jgi:hypothetical protein